MLSYNKKIVNKLLILQVVLFLFYITLSYSQNSSHYKTYLQKEKQQSHINEYISSSKYYLLPTDRNIYLKSLSLSHSTLPPWLGLNAILILYQSHRQFRKYHNNIVGLYKKLKNILNPKYHRSKYKDSLII